MSRQEDSVWMFGLVVVDGFLVGAVLKACAAGVRLRAFILGELGRMKRYIERYDAFRNFEPFLP